MNRVLLLIFKLCISLALAWYAIDSANINSLLSLFFTFRFQYALPVIFFSYVCVWIIGACNLYVLANVAGRAQIPVRSLIHIFLQFNSWGYLMPGKLGELSLGYLLLPYKVPVGTSLFYLYLDKAISLFIYLGFAGLYLILTGYSTIGIILIAIAPIFFLICLMLVQFKILSSIFLYISPKVICREFKRFKLSGRMMLCRKPYIVLLNILLTIFKITLHGLGYFMMFTGFGVRIDVIYIISACSFLHLGSLIPLTFSGIGMTELIGMESFSQVGVPPDIAVGSVLAFNVGSVFLSVLLLWFFSFHRTHNSSPYSNQEDDI